MSYQTRITSITVVNEGMPIFAEEATVVSIDDEGGGEFVSVKQFMGSNPEIRINPEEWPDIKAAIDRMVGECREVIK